LNMPIYEPILRTFEPAPRAFQRLAHWCTAVEKLWPVLAVALHVTIGACDIYQFLLCFNLLLHGAHCNVFHAVGAASTSAS
jgi:hypothetical protein